MNAFYLQHRYSEDLDFFTEKKFDNEAVFTILELWSKQHNFTFTAEFHQVVYIFLLKFNNSIPLKVDFGYYPYKQIAKTTIINGIQTDSIVDIAVNKLLTITQRSAVKDFVDLYFLLEQFSIWDLMEGVRIKFKKKFEPLFIASSLLNVEEFEYLPKMIKPLDLETLQAFFREKAKELGRKVVE